MNEEVKLTFKNSVTNMKRVQEYNELLGKVKTMINSMPKGFSLGNDYTKQLEKTNKLLVNLNKNMSSFKRSTTSALGNMKQPIQQTAAATKQMANELKDIKNKTDDASESGKKLQKAFNLTSLIVGFKKFANLISNSIEKTSSYIESLNALDVAFNNKSQGINKYINQFSEMYNLDESAVTKTVSQFKLLANAMNIPEKTGENLSKVLNQLALDTSSLFNVSYESAVSKLTSGLSGQTKAVRTLGIDITETSLQQELMRLGIERNINTLTYAEKRLIIVSAMMSQASDSQNDFGRTSESLSNQMKILNEQWNRLSRAVGNVFFPIVKAVLPYLNAILMVITEIINTIASVLGFSMEGEDYFSRLNEEIYDFSDGLGVAGSNAKKLKSGLRGFDKLNVISSPSSGGGGGAGGTGLGIDKNILNSFNKAFEKYDNNLKSIKTKATKIRDAIMETLGFTKEINPLTGDVVFKYNGWQATVKGIWGWFKKLTPSAKILTILIAGLITAKTISLLTKFIKLLGATGLGKVIISLLSPVKSLLSWAKLGIKVNGNLVSGISEGIGAWKSELGIIGKLKTTLVGAAGLYAGYKLIISATDEIAKKNEITTTSFLKLAGGIASATASGALIGSTFGGVFGAVIGASVGLLGSLYTTFMNMPTEISRTTDAIVEQNEKTRNYLDTLKETNKEIEENLTNELTVTGVHKTLLKELQNITEANGKVKKGYEDRAQFIISTLNDAYGLEIKIIDGVILQYGKQIKSISNVIKAKEAEILLNANKDKYAKALQEENTLWANKEKQLKNTKIAQQNANDAQEEYNRAYEHWYTVTAYGKSIDIIASWNLYKKKKALKETNKVLVEAKKLEKEATDAFVENQKIKFNYSELSVAVITEDYKKIDEATKKYTNTIKTESGSEQMTLAERIKKTHEGLTLMTKEYETSSKQIQNSVKSSYETIYNETLNELTSMTTLVDGKLGTDVIDAWRTLAETSEKKFMEYFGKLNPDIQQEVVDQAFYQGLKLSENLQKGISQKYPTIEVKPKTSNFTIKFDANTKDAENKVNLWLYKFTGGLDAILNIRTKSTGGLFNGQTWHPINQYAGGGLPPVGQMFIAREKGPELVGQIGSHTAVVNNNQIVSSVAKGVYDAVRSANNGGSQVYNIYLDENHKIGTYTLEQLQDMAKSNGKPITIG